ncbi:MAG: replicative DNA helicase [Bacteroidetes bacterium]|nr:replicative DNA helicase [Bacteroidota bacterium]
MSTEKSTRRKANPLSFVNPESMPGKLPPQATDLEEAVLGALMLDKNAVAEVIDILKPEAFYKESNNRIFAAIQQLFHSTQPVDILTVTQQLRKSGDLEIAGGAYYITQLTNRVASAANVEFHARIVLQKFIQRELIRISSETIRDAFEDTTDVLDLLDKAEKNLFGIAESNIRRKYESMSGLVTKALKEVETAAKQDSGVTGVASGFTELDRVTAGWQKSDLIIIAARPGMGKTAFVLSLARNAAVRFQKPVAFFSLEMSSIQLVNRLVASETEIDTEKLKKGTLAAHEWQQLNLKVAPLTTAPIYIDDTPALSVFELRAKCRRLASEKKIEMIIIDYLQLMVGGQDNKNGNREQEISHISRSLKGIAKELNIPIIALSQLSRNVEKSQTKKPQLSDLRESGAIEQDADMVMFIYRPEYYGLTETEDNTPANNLAEIIIAKNRNGALKSVNLKFIGHLTKFTDYETYDFMDESNSGQGPSPVFPNPGIDSSRITRTSRMNDEEDAPY